MEASTQIEADRAASWGLEMLQACSLYCYCLYILAVGRETGNSLSKYNCLSLSVKHSKSVFAQDSLAVVVKLDRLQCAQWTLAIHSRDFYFSNLWRSFCEPFVYP